MRSDEQRHHVQFSPVRGMIQGACTKLQKEAGIDDSVEEFDKYLTAVAEGFENPELRRLYAEKSGETIDWLAEQGAALSTDQPSTREPCSTTITT